MDAAFVFKADEIVEVCCNEIESSLTGFDYELCGPGKQRHDEHPFLFAPQLLRFAGGPEVVGQTVTRRHPGGAAAPHGAGIPIDHAVTSNDWHPRRHVALTGPVANGALRSSSKMNLWTTR